MLTVVENNGWYAIYEDDMFYADGDTQAYIAMLEDFLQIERRPDLGDFMYQEKDKQSENIPRSLAALKSYAKDADARLRQDIIRDINAEIASLRARLTALGG